MSQFFASGGQSIGVSVLTVFEQLIFQAFLSLGFFYLFVLHMEREALGRTHCGECPFKL